MELAVLCSPPVILGEAAQEVGEVRQGCAEGEMKDGGNAEMSNLDTALLS